jgi:hypothetical protein
MSSAEFSHRLMLLFCFLKIYKSLHAKQVQKKFFFYPLDKRDKTCSALMDVIFGDPEVTSHTSEDVQTVNTRSDLTAMEVRTCLEKIKSKT